MNDSSQNVLVRLIWKMLLSNKKLFKAKALYCYQYVLHFLSHTVLHISNIPTKSILPSIQLCYVIECGLLLFYRDVKLEKKRIEI